ncbi:MAG TPA: ABC transporter permease [Dongiaceae bacterium]|nr:ABC transporter permease [Dongiaceae bacterium]
MNLLTELAEGLSISWAAICANKMRSVLTTLGIIIGVVTVTLMGTAISGLNKSFLNTVSFIAPDVLFVDRFEWAPHSREEWLKIQKRRPLTLEQATQLEQRLKLSQAVAPMITSRGWVQYKKESAGGVNVIGTTDQFVYTGGIGISQGRFFSPAEADGGRPVCVIGSLVATNLFNGSDPLGARIQISNQPYEVVGVLQKQGTFIDSSFDNQVIIPIPQMIANFNHTRDLDQIQVKVKSLAGLEEAREELHSAMRQIRQLAPSDPDDFAINQQEQVLTMIHKVTGTIAAIGLFITGLSLFVGGIGIMNIMFVSVNERTREIGLRKAIGAKRRSILLQFLIEAATICLIGGLAGLGLAWPLTLLMQRFLPATLSPAIVGVALGVSLVTGLLSGILPAWRAARMNPVDALRNE